MRLEVNYLGTALSPSRLVQVHSRRNRGLDGLLFRRLVSQADLTDYVLQITRSLGTVVGAWQTVRSRSFIINRKHDINHPPCKT